MHWPNPRWCNLFLLLAPSLVWAQPSPAPSIIYVTSDPAGACTARLPLRFNTANGKLWGCDSLVWTQIGGGGGATPGAPDNSLQYRVNSTTLGGTSALYGVSVLLPIIADTITGLNDLFLVSTTYTDLANPNSSFNITIDGTGTPDTFSWTKNGSGGATGVAITGANQVLSDGVTIKFSATTGHALNDDWFVLTGSCYTTNGASLCYNGLNTPDVQGTWLQFADQALGGVHRVTGQQAGIQLFSETNAYIEAVRYGDLLHSVAPPDDSQVFYTTANVYDPSYGASTIGQLTAYLSGALVPNTHTNGQPGKWTISAFDASQVEQVTTFDGRTNKWAFPGRITPGSVTFAALPSSPSNADGIYCSDCKVTSGSDNTCVASGSGAQVFRINSVWKCVQ